MLGKGLSIGYMEQDPILCEFSTLNEYVYSGASENNFHLVEMIGNKLGIDLEVSIAASSGGERRRAALTKLIAGDHDIMLLLIFIWCCLVTIPGSSVLITFIFLSLRGILL